MPVFEYVYFNKSSIEFPKGPVQVVFPVVAGKTPYAGITSQRREGLSARRVLCISVMAPDS